MKKKLLVGILSSAFILGAGTLTFAQTNGEGDGLFNFEKMQPQIEKIHPELSKEEQKEMFDACHGEGGMMENFHGENASNMMNQF
ncbi:hypothetical protein PZE06_23195 [Robertmurraya sp. DFI.2.37]|uniref:hypothetical protein n=1 Tax=Robertmurraya sp. DFI.2.37 TaxID=3031819 RepID=UPI0012448BB4|nr:hypothetical protein [Robertmurraya sp. DFI.2.37]MDF1511044.1 hypothetical protein [Robertmurraya sp. DFI.2.37]